MFFNLKTGFATKSGHDPCLHVGDGHLFINSYGMASAFLGPKGFDLVADKMETVKLDKESVNFDVELLNAQITKDEDYLLEFYSHGMWFVFQVKSQHKEAFISWLRWQRNE